MNRTQYFSFIRSVVIVFVYIYIFYLSTVGFVVRQHD